MWFSTGLISPIFFLPFYFFLLKSIPLHRPSLLAILILWGFLINSIYPFLLFVIISLSRLTTIITTAILPLLLLPTSLAPRYVSLTDYVHVG